MLNQIRHNPVFAAIVSIALVCYTITAYYSSGFFHADEHYQIIEFAGIKLGTHSPHELAWEFNAKIRPTLQPTLCFIIFKFLGLFGLKNPYSLAFVLRFITAFFSLFVISKFIHHTEGRLKHNHSKYLLYFLSFFIWFIPFIGVRFSSETWSGLFFVLGLIPVIKNNIKAQQFFVSGLFFGLAFLFRFQIAFAIIPVFTWLFLIKKETLLNLMRSLLGVFLLIILGTVIDSWFYGEFVFTPWELALEYFNQNIATNGVSYFEGHPWDFYISQIFWSPYRLIGIVMLFSLVITLLFKPKSIFLWIVIFFILIHSFIPHKETRFIFPVVFLLPIIITSSYDYILNSIKHNKLLKLGLDGIFSLFILSNLIGLPFIMFRPAGNGITNMTKYIKGEYKNDEVQLIHGWYANPYNPWHGIPIKFYQQNNITDFHIESLCQLNDSTINSSKKTLLIIREVELSLNRCNANIINEHFVLKHQSIPNWMNLITIQLPEFKNGDNLLLYEKK